MSIHNISGCYKPNYDSNSTFLECSKSETGYNLVKSKCECMNIEALMKSNGEYHSAKADALYKKDKMYEIIEFKGNKRFFEKGTSECTLYNNLGEVKILGSKFLYKYSMTKMYIEKNMCRCEFEKFSYIIVMPNFKKTAPHRNLIREVKRQFSFYDIECSILHSYEFDNEYTV